MTDPVEQAKAAIRSYLKWALPDIKYDPEHAKQLARWNQEKVATVTRLVTLPNGNTASVPFYDDERGAELIERARGGDTDAANALDNIADIVLTHGRQLPPNLARYVADRLRGRLGPFKRARRANSPMRDKLIIEAVECVLRQDLGFFATRNEATGRPCACSIVAETLSELGGRISEKAIKEVWERRGDVAAN